MAPIVPLVTRLATVTDGHMQGRNEGDTIPQVPNHHGALNHCGVAEKFKNVTSAFFNAVHFLSHDLSFEHGGAKLASHPERHLTRYAPGHMVLS